MKQQLYNNYGDNINTNEDKELIHHYNQHLYPGKVFNNSADLTNYLSSLLPNSSSFNLMENNSTEYFLNNITTIQPSQLITTTTDDDGINDGISKNETQNEPPLEQKIN